MIFNIYTFILYAPAVEHEGWDVEAFSASYTADQTSNSHWQSLQKVKYHLSNNIFIAILIIWAATLILYYVTTVPAMLIFKILSFPIMYAF